MTEPKPVRAWAVVGCDGQVEPEAIFATENKANFHVFFAFAKDATKKRIIPVEIRPLADTEREER